MSNNPSDYDYITKRIVETLLNIDWLSMSYQEKLRIWSDCEINVTALCICDTTNLLIRQNFGYDEVVVKPGFSPPNYENVFNVQPEYSSEEIHLNIHNVNKATNHIGSFDNYKVNFLNFIESQKDSKLLEDWLSKEIQGAEKECTPNNNDVSYGFRTGVAYWYNAFLSNRESLNADDYQIWIPRAMKYKESARYKHPFWDTDKDKTPKLCYWITDLQEILNIAEGFLYTQKLPFLKSLKNQTFEELYPILDNHTSEVKQGATITYKKEQSIKLTWQGDKKVLVNVLRQLKTAYNKKGQALIKESYDDIAAFMIQHINGFENVQISTLRGLLTKELEDPKGNFVSLDLTEPDQI